MRILMIAKYFPPAGSARAVQAGRLASALAAKGAEVVIIAGRPDGSAPIPHPPGIEVHQPAYPDGSRHHPQRQRLIRVYHTIADMLWRSRWRRQAIKAITESIARKRPDVVLSLSLPFDPHRLAADVATRHRLPWVAYCSDPWPPGLLPPPYGDREFWPLTAVQVRDARRTLRSVDAVVAPTKQMLEFMQHKDILPQACRTEAIEHIGAAPTASESVPVALHAGLISRARASINAARGLALLAEKIHAEGGRLLQLGEVDDGFRNHFRGLESHGAIEFLPQVPADEAATWISRSRLLLIIEADCDASPFVPSKLADYAMTGSPVLAITPPGSALRAVAADFPWLFVAGHDPDEIVEAGLAAWAMDRFPPNASNPFQPDRVASRFLALLDDVIGQSR